MMVKLDVYGGLLGSGKTTLIRQMLSSAYMGHKTAIVENEAGKVNLDGEVLRSASVSVKEISSGCICCTVKGSFSEGVKLLAEQEKPDYIVVEPSGAADLTGVVRACRESGAVELNRVIMVVNAQRIQKLLKVVGDFYLEQIRGAETIYLNFTEGMSAEQTDEVRKTLLGINPNAEVTSVPLAEITSETFPEKVFSKEGILKEAEKSERLEERKDRSLRVLEKSEEGSGSVRIHSGKGQALVSWSYEFHGNFSEKDVQNLMEIFRMKQCEGIWRVKGCLTMGDGTFRKVDVAFGDEFQEELRDFPMDKSNFLSVTGRRLNLPWLKKKLEGLPSGSCQ